MDGCPASAYTRDLVTGAVILDEKKCIGCRYCQWNCPYDAPKFDTENRTISKCNLCFEGLKEGRQPACSSGCPTGALSYGEIDDRDTEMVYSWFPDKKLNPAIKFTAKGRNLPLRIIPDNRTGNLIVKPENPEKILSSEISLVLFSFLATLSVAAFTSSVVKGLFPDLKLFLPLIMLTGIVSLFHLGRKIRFWRSVMNLKKSPLSREIAAFIVYSSVSLSALILQSPGLLIAGAVSGLIFLILIDSVYIFSDGNKSVYLHSGQTFISALMVSSFLSGIVLPYIFIVFLKFSSLVFRMLKRKLSNSYIVLMFLRFSFLVIPSAYLILNNFKPDLVTVFIFLTGELLDRILFYIDFNPVHINTLMNDQLNIDRDEKERS
jgi:DMSO reductase anchor subunit/ferredoxin